MSISEMSDEDRAELFVVLGDVREEIRDLRTASKTMRQVVVPREEHLARRRFTMVLFAIAVFTAMNLNFAHAQYCVPPYAYPKTGSAQTFACDVVYPAFSHAQVGPRGHYVWGKAGTPLPALVPPRGPWPSSGNLLGMALYLVLVVVAMRAWVKLRRLYRGLGA